MSKIGLVRRVKYAGDVHTELLKAGWDSETAALFLNNIPDATYVKHGRWKGEGMGDYSCSLCTEIVSGNTHNYCPNCGARMDGGSDA